MTKEQAVINNVKRQEVLMDLWIRLPELENIEVGHTGYLDKLKGDCMSAPAMKGVDKLGRKFIAFRLRQTSMQKGVAKESLGTLVCFERYEGDGREYRLWVKAHHGITFGDDVQDRSCGSIHTQLLFMLLEGQEVEIPAYNHNYPYSARLDV